MGDVTPRSGGRNHGINALRGIAATLVVITHAINVSLPRFPEFTVGHMPYRIGGVDVFFVISGFIMSYSTRKYLDGRLDGTGFLRRRLLRIAPLYWLVTLAVGTLVAIRPAFSDRPFSLAFLIASLTFFPYHVGNDTLRTSILPQAWTLGYEMIFYLLFALFTSVNYRKGIIGLCLLLTGLVAFYPVAANFYTSYFTNPVWMDIVAGILLSFLPLEKVGRIRWILIVVGFLWLGLLFPQQGESRGTYMRVWAATPGAAMIVAGFSQLKNAGNWRIFVLGGNISYSIFLSHMYLMKPVASKLRLGLVPSVAILVLIGVATGYLVNRLIEKPLNSWVQKMFGSA